MFPSFRSKKVLHNWVSKIDIKAPDDVSILRRATTSTVVTGKHPTKTECEETFGKVADGSVLKPVYKGDEWHEFVKNGMKPSESLEEDFVREY